jgi:hypothetical protein
VQQGRADTSPCISRGIFGDAHLKNAACIDNSPAGSGSQFVFKHPAYRCFAEQHSAFKVNIEKIKNMITWAAHKRRMPLKVEEYTV